MNLPNGLTLVRVLLTPAIVIQLLYDYTGAALLTFLLAGLTDALDGFLARSRRQRTELGRILDPLADKALLGSAFVTMGVLGDLPLWLVIIGVSRDAILMVGSLILYIQVGRLGNPPSALGKVTTLLQLVTVLLALGVDLRPTLQPVLPPAVWATAAATVLSGLHYIVQGARQLNVGPVPSSGAGAAP
ncbi:MAG: CDP-alcohol phosphatidyltransferase family protein [candidate division NC10 bacterium]|nr:CDP-alcohol phosphatidyltransferase family protein [candidate division NC10 bacterium]